MTSWNIRTRQDLEIFCFIDFILRWGVKNKGWVVRAETPFLGSLMSHTVSASAEVVHTQHMCT